MEIRGGGEGNGEERRGRNGRNGMQGMRGR